MLKALSRILALAVSLIVWALLFMLVWWLAGKVGAQDELSDLLGAGWALVQDFAHSVATSAREAAAR